MLMRGHTLVWYGAMPNWTKQISSAAEAERELTNHIESVVVAVSRQDQDLARCQ